MAKKREYKARVGSRISDEDALILGPELERLAKAGRASTDDLLEEATKESSPLHDYLTWDPDVALVKCQKEELRHIARAVEVELVINGVATRRPILISVQFEVPAAEEADRMVILRTYQTPDQIKRDPESVQSVIEDARRDLLSVSRKYRQYLEMFSEFGDEYGTLFEMIDDLEPVGV
jgi:hypothetical protein